MLRSLPPPLTSLLARWLDSQLRRVSAIRAHFKCIWPRFPLARLRQLGMEVGMFGSRSSVCSKSGTNSVTLTNYSQGKDQSSAPLSPGQARERLKYLSKSQLRYLVASIFFELKVSHFIPRAVQAEHSFIFRVDRLISPAAAVDLQRIWWPSLELTRQLTLESCLTFTIRL